MAQFLNDTFTDTSGTTLASHTGETGATWALVVGGTAQISDANRCRASTGSTEIIYYASGTPATAEYDVTATVRIVSSVATGGIAGRQNTGANTGYIWVFEASGPRITLYRVSGGGYSELGAYSHGLSAGTDAVIKLELRDAAKKGYVDGVERVSSGNNDVTAAGQAAAWFYSSVGVSDSAGFHIDQISASDPGGAEVAPVGHFNNPVAFGI